jgi:hypothetical protein
VADQPRRIPQLKARPARTHRHRRARAQEGEEEGEEKGEETRLTEGELRPVGDPLHEGVDEHEAERGGSEDDAKWYQESLSDLLASESRRSRLTSKGLAG